MVEITKKEAVNLLQNRKSGRFFTVTFVKRSNGEVRVMNCRKGVTKHLRGGELRYDPAQKNLITVYDIPKRAYRSVNLEAVKEIRADKNIYSVV